MEDIVQSIAQGLELLESFGEIPMRETFATDDDSFGDENKTFSIRESEAFSDWFLEDAKAGK